MKQLKFMLAAATAVGFAAAAQAASLSNTPLVNDTFDSATLPAGYSYDGDVEADNESAVKDGVLEVNTGTDPLLRALDFGESARDVNLADEKFDSLVIDTMVQFTVTPAGDKVDAGDDDKIMIYLAEVTNETGVVTGTNLMVKASKIVQTSAGGIGGGVKTSYEPMDVAVSNYEVEAGKWYNLKVVSTLNTAKCVVFKVMMKDPAIVDGDFVVLQNDISLDPNDATVFPSLLNTTATTLTYVGFAGEGKVDDLKVNLFELATSVDFTLTLGEGVSAVEWTINGNKKYEADNASFDAGTTIVVSIDSVTYEAGYAGTQDWTAWTYNKAETGSIKITAEKFADVSGDVVTPTDATITAAAGGAFACPASDAADYAVAVEKLGKAVTWATSVAKKSYNDAMTFINDMDFDEVTTNNVVEAAYLFNCEPTPAAVAAEAAAFKFPSFTKDMTIDAMKAAVEADKNYNGTVEIHGATTLENGGDWANGKSGSFYKAVLTK